MFLTEVNPQIKVAVRIKLKPNSNTGAKTQTPLNLLTLKALASKELSSDTALV